MTSINFIPLDYDYFDFQGKNYIRIIGRDEKGKRACVVDHFDPFLWAIFEDSASEKRIKDIQKKIEKIEIKLPSRTTKVERTEIHEKKFLSKKVKAIKIFITNYKDAHPIADKLDFKEIKARREYDINIITKYITEKKLIPLSWHKISGEILNNSQEFGNIDSAFDIDVCIKAEKIEKLNNKKFRPKFLAFDIESDELELGKGEILMISLVSDNFKKVLTWKKSSEKLNYVEYFKSEAEMLKTFINYVNKISPDILVGYFSDGFDIPYLKARAEKNKIKLALGLDKSQPSFIRGRIPKARISGIVHVDLFRFIESVYSQYLQSETLGLNEVAFELLGEGKKEFNHKHSSKIKEHEWKDYFEYNLQDSILTYKLAEKLWPDMIEFSGIIQEPLFEITRNSMSQLVESYILHNLDKYNEIAEKRPLHDEIKERRQMGKYVGAFVFQPKPGLYKNIVMFDFTSMYASVIFTYNLSLSTFLKKKFNKTLEVNLEKGKVYFSKEQGFFPLMLSEIIEKRKKYKKEYKQNPNPIAKARSNAYKLLANASYGYQGFFGARYYCREAAASTAALARKNILDTIDKIKKQSYEIIYSDTDSIAFLLGKKSKKQTIDFLKKLNSELPGIMELELEDFYKRGLFVAKRTVKLGAKKKYALINEKGKFKIRGFETVRRDWCNLARNLQNKILQKILKEGNEKKALEILKKTVDDLKKRKILKEQIIIRTQLKKPLSEYKAITPHVIAAEKIKKSGKPIDMGMLIEYYIAETKIKKSLVREKVKLPEEKGEYNIKYYLEHQIIPAVENIFEVFGIKKEDILQKDQRKLHEF
ncbi:MAG: ribonuclease H-like domain-containing protein [Candidatus Pacearchaeota archaeon]|nr:MAG: ribonuclease H-like domain-containing protein [Candidatus Pacearchaeota archaeon]